MVGRPESRIEVKIQVASISFQEIRRDLRLSFMGKDIRNSRRIKITNRRRRRIVRNLRHLRNKICGLSWINRSIMMIVRAIMIMRD